MGTLCISEFQDWPLIGIPVAEQAVEFGATPVSSKPFHPLTKGIRIISDVSCALGLRGTADPHKHRMAADSERDYQTAGIQSLSVVATARAENVSELEALMAYSQAMQAATKMTDPAWLDGRLAELAAATEAHEQAKAEAGVALAEAKGQQVLAASAHAVADEMRAAIAPEQEKIAVDRAAAEAAHEEVAKAQAALVVQQAALAADWDKLTKDRASLNEEVERRIAAIKEDYAGKMRDLGDSVGKVRAREEEVAKREAAMKAAEAEHAANLAQLQAFTQKLSGG